MLGDGHDGLSRKLKDLASAGSGVSFSSACWHRICLRRLGSSAHGYAYVITTDFAPGTLCALFAVLCGASISPSACNGFDPQASPTLPLAASLEFDVLLQRHDPGSRCIRDRPHRRAMVPYRGFDRLAQQSAHHRVGQYLAGEDQSVAVLVQQSVGQHRLGTFPVQRPLAGRAVA